MPKVYNRQSARAPRIRPQIIWTISAQITAPYDHVIAARETKFAPVPVRKKEIFADSPKCLRGGRDSAGDIWVISISDDMSGICIQDCLKNGWMFP